MTKEEIKSLISNKIKENTTGQITATNLATILNEIVETLPERAPITIDLSGYDLDFEIDVTDAIPTGYIPQYNDCVYHPDYGKMMLSGCEIGNGFISADYGFHPAGAIESMLIFRLQKDNSNKWLLSFAEV